MSKALGTDLIEISRIKEAIEKHGERFLNRIYTPAEIAYCQSKKNPYPHFAGRFAAKEAISKALGTGITPALPFTAIEVLPNEKGAPLCTSHPHILISITHSRDLALATALLT